MEKGNRTVTVPNHGPNSEIPIGILRSIWSQVGLIRSFLYNSNIGNSKKEG